MSKDDIEKMEAWAEEWKNEINKLEENLIAGYYLTYEDEQAIKKQLQKLRELIEYTVGIARGAED